MSVLFAISWKIHTMDHTKEMANGSEHEDDYVNKILFGAGATLAMACLKRLLVMVFVEQWRSRVFLILNLVLLAIFFTSVHSSSSENRESSCDERKIQEKKRKKQCVWSEEAETQGECEQIGTRDEDEDEDKDKDKNELEHVKVDSEDQQLSKEELNERVEAFIAMFRQHLVSDARKSRSKPFPLKA
ncbi:uncharacterized protein LOC110602521 [Manihot esculenta]|uniref:Uncharacterized protein n=2 Tax=Manihot esculenta TaxID=3983 RepID=A0ACB7GCH2_MANES|nr:uncharacterized protein LOC110602521 [Manihot esculenta]KAG8637942.1 hypothetical protein MANES_15G177500v8 [Manihot esculenta]